MNAALALVVSLAGQIIPPELERLEQQIASIKTIRAGFIQYVMPKPGSAYQGLREIEWTQKGDWILARVIDWKLTPGKNSRQQRNHTITYLLRGDINQALSNSTLNVKSDEHQLRPLTATDTLIFTSFWHAALVELERSCYPGPRALTYPEAARRSKQLGFSISATIEGNLKFANRNSEEEITIDPATGVVRRALIRTISPNRHFETEVNVIATQTHGDLTFPKFTTRRTAMYTPAGISPVDEIVTELRVHEINGEIDDSEFQIPLPIAPTEIAFDHDNERVSELRAALQEPIAALIVARTVAPPPPADYLAKVRPAYVVAAVAILVLGLGWLWLAKKRIGQVWAG